MPSNVDFAQFLDEVRESRNITRETLIDGVISMRQYYRFLKGESTLKSDVILALLQKLELDNEFFYTYFKKQNDGEFKTLLDIYGYVYIKNIDKANNLINKINPNHISSSSNIKLYNFIKLYILVKQNKMSYAESVEKLKEIINYPKILDKTLLTFVEKTALSYMTNHLLSIKDYRIAKLYKHVLKEEIKTDSVLNKDFNVFRGSAAKCLSVVGEYQEAYNILLSAARNFMESLDYIPMIHIYYYKALNELQLFKDDRYKKSLQKMYSLLFLSDDEAFKQSYKKVVEKKFNLKESDLIQYKTE